MNPSRRQKFAGNADREHRWILSYADFLTVLFAFFAFLFSISSLQNDKFQEVSATLLQIFDVRPSSVDPIELNATPTGPDVFNPLFRPEPLPGTNIDNANSETYAQESSLLDIRAQLSDAYAQMIQDRLFSVSGNESWIEIQLANSITFSDNSADINDQAEAVLYELAKLLQGQTLPVRVEGYSDSSENQGWQLSSDRAVAVVEYLQRAGIAGERLSSAAFSSHQPSGEGDLTPGRIQIVVAGFSGINPEARSN